ncbi:MAG: hypothetical protein Phog2KO_38250 [Phototrophicaceae bacterium]
MNRKFDITLFMFIIAVLTLIFIIAPFEWRFIAMILLLCLIPIVTVKYIDSSIGGWKEKPSITPDKLTKSLNTDYANPSVHYDIRRLGDESYRHTFPNNYRKARFIIDDKRIKLRNFIFHADDIQWFGRYKNSNSVRLSVNLDGFWYRLSINSDKDDDNFYKKLFERIPDKLKRSKYLNRPDVSSWQGTKAHITQQNLQGIFEDFEAVELYVTPLWLVVLSNGYVIEQHFIDDVEDIRSVKHPTHINDDMLLLTFYIGDDMLMYSYEDKGFVTRLSDATRSGFDTSAPRKKKQNEN